MYRGTCDAFFGQRLGTLHTKESSCQRFNFPPLFAARKLSLSTMFLSIAAVIKVDINMGQACVIQNFIPIRKL